MPEAGAALWRAESRRSAYEFGAWQEPKVIRPGLFRAKLTSLAKAHRDRSRPDPDCSRPGTAGAGFGGGTGRRSRRTSHGSRISKAYRIVRRTALAHSHLCFRGRFFFVAGDQPGG